jgi:predicted phosphodiesterase
VSLALVSDIHGNDRAFAAVVAELERLGVLGNADDFLLELPADSPEEITERQLEKRAWTLSQLEQRHLDQIRSFQATVEIDRVLAFHGSPGSYDDVLLPETENAGAWRVPGFDVLAGGHTHLQWTRRIDGALYVNPGSVGVSDDGLAQFAIVTGASVAFERVPY